MNEDINYWMFRVSNRWGYKTKICFDNNLVYCGWDVNLIQDSSEEILKKSSWTKKMAIKFTYIKKNDIIVMPVSGGIAIGRAGEKEYRDDWDWKNTLKVEWLTKFYPRRDLSSKFQSSLKYRGTFLNLNRYKNDLDKLISIGFTDLFSHFQTIEEEQKTETIKVISEHINSNKNLKFQDREFEYFILHLLELHYEGLEGQMNNQIQEAKDGKDLTMSVDFDDFDINISINVQVKQYEGEVPVASLSQIGKSDDTGSFTKNVLVTTGKITDELKKKAEDEKIFLFGPEDIALMIFENFENIDEKYYSKLNMTKTIKIATENKQ